MKNNAALGNKKAGVGVGVIALVIAGIVLFSKRDVVAAMFKPGGPAVTPLTDPSLSLEKAPAAAAAYLDSIAAKYSDDTSLQSHIAQAKQSVALVVAQGISLSEDSGAATFTGQLAAYEAYRDDGGTASFGNFSVYDVGMTPEYQAIIDSFKQAWNEREADRVIQTYAKTDGYGVPTGEISTNLLIYLDVLSEGNPVKQELLTRPEVQSMLAPAPAAAAPAAAAPAAPAAAAATPAPPAPAPYVPPPPAPVLAPYMTEWAYQFAQYAN